MVIAVLGTQSTAIVGGRERTRRRSWSTDGLALVALLVTAVPPRAAHAASCPSPAGAEPLLARLDARERLAWIDRHLVRTAAHSRTWAWGWGLGLTASGIGSLAAVPFVAPGERVDWYTNAVSAAIGVIPLVVSPPAVIRDADRVHAALVTLPPGDDAAVCHVLAEAERAFDADAAEQAFQQSWWLHAGNVAFNTGILLFLGLGYQHWTSGIINGVAGVAVGEALILTQPSATVEDAVTYRRGLWSPEITARITLP